MLAAPVKVGMAGPVEEPVPCAAPGVVELTPGIVVLAKIAPLVVGFMG